MRVLYLCHRIPYPPDKGDKIRAFYQIKAIATQHEVDVFTLADDLRDLAGQSALAAYCTNLKVVTVRPKLARLRALPYLFGRTPLTLPYFYSAELAGHVQSALRSRSYDRIFVYCSAMAQYVEANSDIPMLTDLVDVDSDKWTQYAGFASFPFSAVYRREGRALREYEKKICEKSRCVIVTTEREARLLREISSNARVYVVPNGVDTAHFAPSLEPDRGSPTVSFTGDMSYFPNEEAVTFFANRVLPLIRQSVPDTQFLIVGRNPSRRVQELRNLGGIEVTGFVPDVRTYLARTWVSVAPFSIASGIQNKILEAMAFGLPVVATRRAAQGLSAGVADAVYTADTPEDLAARIVSLLEDSELRRRRGLEGRQRVMTEYNWDLSQEKLLQLIDNWEHPSFRTTPAESSMA